MKLQFVPMHKSEIVIRCVLQGDGINAYSLKTMFVSDWEKFKQEGTMTGFIGGRLDGVRYYYRDGVFYIDHYELLSRGA